MMKKLNRTSIVMPNMNHLIRFSMLLTLSCLTTGVFACCLNAQETSSKPEEGPQKSVAKTPKGKPGPIDAEIRVFELQHFEAEEAMSLITELMGGKNPSLRLAVASKSSLVIAGDKRTLEEAQALLIRLDVESPKKPAKQYQVFVLRNRAADEAATVVRTLLGTPDTPFKISVDSRTNTLIVAGDESEIEMIAKIIDFVDSDSVKVNGGKAAAEHKKVEIQLFWVIEDKTEVKSMNMPKDVLAKITKAKLYEQLEFSNPKLIAKTSVQCDIEGKSVKVSARKVPSTLGVGRELEMFAEIEHKDGRFKLGLEITAGAYFSTSISTKEGHPICFASSMASTKEIHETALILIVNEVKTK